MIFDTVYLGTCIRQLNISKFVNFPFLDGDVPRSTSYGVYISQLIRFARASSFITDSTLAKK